MRNSIYQVLVYFLILSFAGFSQSAQENYGKNRIQYQNFKWSIISTDNFDIYYYPQSKNAAVLAANYAEHEFERIADFLGYAPYSRIKLIVYATHSDYLQSNIGLVGQTVFIGGYTVFLKNRVEVSFNGVQTDFLEDISRGIAQMILNEMMYGGNFKEVLKSTYFMSLPEWFLSGLIEYIATGWSIEADDNIRDLFTSKNFKKPHRFTGEDAKTVGHSVWNYLVERYGKSNIANILNQTRYIKNHERAMEDITNRSYNQLLKDWRSYYLSLYATSVDSLKMPPVEQNIIKKTRDEAFYGSIKLSPDGTRMAYVQNRRGRYKVFMKNLQNGKKYVVYRGGYRSFDQKINYDLPVVSWRNNDKIGIISVKHDKMKLVTYDIKKEIKSFKEWFKLEVSNFFNLRYTSKQTYRGIYKHFRQVNDFNFSEDGATIIMSGENFLGQSDIFIYNLRNNNVTPITNDIFDDRNPVFFPKSTKSFVFNSNRVTDTLLPTKKYDFRSLKSNHDIFYYNPDSSKVFAKRITNSSYNEINPKIDKNGTIFFLSDENGIYELYKKEHIDKKPVAITNFRQNILSYDINNTQSDLAYLMQVNGKKRFYLDTNFNFQNTYPNLLKTGRQIIFDNVVFDYNTTKNILPQITEKKPVVTRYELEKARKSASSTTDTVEIDPYNYVFEFEKKQPVNTNLNSNNNNSNKINPNNNDNAGIRKDTGDVKGNVNLPGVTSRPRLEAKLKFNTLYISSPVRYKNDFGIDNVTSAIRIDPLRGFGVQAGAHMSDIMANHRFNAQMFGAMDFRTSIMSLEYEYLKKRIDFRFKFTKDALYWDPGTIIHKYRMNKYEVSMSYPFNPMMRVSLTPFYSNTKYNPLRNTNIVQAVATPETFTDYLGYNFEFNFDNTRSRGLNMVVGSRIKFGITSQAALNAKNKNFTKLSIDARNYVPLLKNLILANRFSAGTFLGRGRKNFLLGGMDNWLFNSTNVDDQNNPLITSPGEDNTDLLFLEYVTNLRGFPYSQLFGNNYVLYNLELRVPFFRSLIRRQIKSNFIRNFQVVGFYDIGTAWSGEAPFAGNNSFNTQIITRDPFTAVVTNYRNPFLQGYGFGFRSMVLGYYGKLDFAWGQTDYVTGPVKVYLTLGYDF